MLLDTNALIWLVHDNASLGDASRALIEAETQVYFSSVSVTEITIKHMLGRIPLPGGTAFPEIFSRSGLIELPLRAEHAATLLDFPTLGRHGPFDRMLLAQAKQERLTLLTSDSTLLVLGEDWILDARH